MAQFRLSPFLQAVPFFKGCPLF